MDWTKIPTDLITSRVPDKEIIAIVKYQLLWSSLEREPTKEVCLRYMTPKQLQHALNYSAAIERRVNADIKSVESHRNRQKLFYQKNQALIKNTDGQADAHTDGQDDAHTDRADKIRLDKIYNIGGNNSSTVDNVDNSETRKEMARKIGDLIKRVPRTPFDYK